MVDQYDGHVQATDEEPSSGRRVPRPSHFECHAPGKRSLRWGSLLYDIASHGGLAACPPRVKNEACALSREEGMAALRHFDALFAGYCGEIIDAAFERFCHEGLAEPGKARPPGAHFRHLVRCQAIAWAEPHPIGNGGAAELSAEEREIVAALSEARQNARQLRGLEKQIFRAMCALDSIAFEHEASKVVLSTAVAFGMRRGTAYQHISRVRRKLFSGPGADHLKDAWKYLLPPSLPLSLAARDYLDACEAREAGLERWMAAHKAHNHHFNALKQRSRSAAAAWRDFVAALDACPEKPVAVQRSLIAASSRLGIDTHVVPAKLRESSWHGLLHRVNRPTRKARHAWRDFLQQPAFGVQVLTMWEQFEREAALAEDATAKVNDAYDALLDAAGARPQNFLDARDEFRSLVDLP
jgi:hypothetical protein